jgi:hypothetical protein
MKVLFAVGTDDSIANSIIKVYQKEYNEIISSKNVYYFKAVVTELQKNHDYDRIVIGEDLEPFVTNNYDTIDKFIFEKLDEISDESINADGRDIPIIVICSERRAKSDDLLTKFFSIGIYDALIGQDRKIEDVCKLLKKPRTKKEAKTYYKIEQGEYEKEDVNNVSEAEIQNILMHYKKLGKNEKKYVESFNRIAEQYSDEQLRIIIKFLPVQVKAVLELESEKYQSIMIYNTAPGTKKTNEKKKEKNQEEKKNALNIEKIVNKNANKLQGNVIIPTEVKSENVKKIKISSDDETEEKNEDIDDSPVEVNENIDEIPVETTIQKKKRGRPRKKPEAEEIIEKPKRGRGRPRKNQDNLELDETLNKNEKNNNNFQEYEEDKMPGIEEESYDDEEDELPGFEEESYDDEEDELPGFEEESYEDEEEELPGFEEESYEDEEEELPGFEEESYEDEEDKLPGFEEENDTSHIIKNNAYYKNNKGLTIEKENNDEIVNISHLITGNKKIVSFVGTSKNGVSFLINNVASILSQRGIKTALVDLTKNKNSYYIYTENDEELRKCAINSMENLENDIAKGIEVNNNFTVYTASPNMKTSEYNIEKILTTLAKNYSLILLDCDLSTNKEFFRNSQEIYLVQSMDVLTIQPLTEFLRKLKINEALDVEKLRIIVNKTQKVKGLTEEMIIGGVSTYNDPEMSLQDRIFNMKTIDYTLIPFDSDAYSIYLAQIANCEISTKGYSKGFMNYMKKLADKIYPEVNASRKKNR